MPHRRETTRKHYEQLVAAYPELKIKGKASAYTSMNGHMFSFITKEGGLAFRLPKEKYEAFVKRYRTQPVIEYGATMREYVAVPVALLKRQKELAGHFADSVAYIASLPPKPTTKPSKKAGKESVKKPAKKKTLKKPAKKVSAKKEPAKKKAAKAAGAKVKAKQPAARKKAKATKKKPARTATTRPAKKSGKKATPRRGAKKRT